jgi:hypothetical protein
MVIALLSVSFAMRATVECSAVSTSSKQHSEIAMITHHNLQACAHVLTVNTEQSF